MSVRRCCIVLVSIGFIISGSCSKDKSSAPPISVIDCATVPSKLFSADVNPVVQSTCNQVGCHASGSFNGPGAITNYNQVFNARVEIRNAIAAGRMPQGGGLSLAQRNAILCWIDKGAPND